MGQGTGVGGKRAFEKASTFMPSGSMARHRCKKERMHPHLPGSKRRNQGGPSRCCSSRHAQVNTKVSIRVKGATAPALHRRTQPVSVRRPCPNLLTTSWVMTVSMSPIMQSDAAYDQMTDQAGEGGRSGQWKPGRPLHQDQTRQAPPPGQRCLPPTTYHLPPPYSVPVQPASTTTPRACKVVRSTSPGSTDLPRAAVSPTVLVGECRSGRKMPLATISMSGQRPELEWVSGLGWLRLTIQCLCRGRWRRGTRAPCGRNGRGEAGRT